MKESSIKTSSRGKRPAREILSRLPEVFGVREAEKYVRYPAQWLVRAESSGQVVRLQRGTYLNRARYPDLTLPYLACHIKSAPSYISCEWALHARGVLLQRPFTCTVVTLSTAVGKKREVRLLGETIEFSHIAESLFWGYEPIQGYFMATAEKAYLDTLYYRRDPEGWGELEKNVLDIQALLLMAEKFPKRILSKIMSMIEPL
jgi:predicted transcriptional regulator of viral defense system